MMCSRAGPEIMPMRSTKCTAACSFHRRQRLRSRAQAALCRVAASRPARGLRQRSAVSGRAPPRCPRTWRRPECRCLRRRPAAPGRGAAPAPAPGREERDWSRGPAPSGTPPAAGRSAAPRPSPWAAP
eukprot:6952526-Lingulodinium_polyedra.AAC.1